MSPKRILVVISIVICSAGLTSAQTEWVKHPDNPVIDPGPPGSWDDNARIPLAVHFDGSVYHLWFMGNNVAWEQGHIGHATSLDGIDWTMDPANPVLTRGEPGEWDDSNHLFGAGVIHDGNQYHLWYTGWGDQTGTIQGGYATSPDGTVWTKHPDNPVLTPGPTGAWDDEGVDPHTVLFDNGVYRMWYSGSDDSATIWQTGYAESTDGVRWTKHPNPVLEVGRYPGAWDSSVVENSYVVFDGTTYHMLYTGGGSGAVSIGYAFSGDGIDWTKHGDSWVLTGSEGPTTTSPVYFDGETFHMWYTQMFNSDGTSRIMYATSDCCNLNWRSFIPAAALAGGSAGAFFMTDVDVSNAGGTPAEYVFKWLPRGQTNGEPLTSERFSLGADMSVRYENVLAEVFGLEPDAVGAIMVEASSPHLLFMSRTYNAPDAKAAGTYGQAIPAVRYEELMRSGERKRIVFGSETADLRTNVGCQNGKDGNAIINLELFSADGTSLGQEMMILAPFANDQINRIFADHQPVNGCVDVWEIGTDARFYCYGSVLDNVTSDPTTIPPQ